MAYLGAVGQLQHDTLNSVPVGVLASGVSETYLPNFLREAIDVCELYYANVGADATSQHDPYRPYILADNLRRIEALSERITQIYEHEMDVGKNEHTKEQKERADALTMDLDSAVKYLLLSRGTSAEQIGKFKIIQSGIAQSYIELLALSDSVLRTCTQTVQRNTKLLDQLDPFKKQEQPASAATSKQVDR